MAREAVVGLASAEALFAALPTAAQQEMAVELAIIGRDVLAAQRAATPVATGALQAGLSFQMLVDRLRVRIGLLGVKKGRHSLFYGRIVNFGRREQVVLTHRLSSADRATWLARIRAGIERRTKKPQDLGEHRSMQVRAMAARPFIDPPGANLEQRAAERAATFWANVLARAGSS